VTVWNAAAGSEPQGRAWRAEYLRLTYGCGAYVPYEELVAAAARQWASSPRRAKLEALWPELPVWSGAQAALDAIEGRARLESSQLLPAGSADWPPTAADLLGLRRDGGDAGYYKPDPRPYQFALRSLGVEPEEAAFVAGFGLRPDRHPRRESCALLAQPRPAGPPRCRAATDFESRESAQLVPWLENTQCR